MRKMVTMVPVIPKSTRDHIGQPVLMPLTKEIMERTRHGIKIKRIAQAMTIRMSMKSHITMITPKNAIMFSSLSYKA